MTTRSGAGRNSGGRGPGAKPKTVSRTTRSRSATPTRRAPKAEVEQVGRQTALTARAAILVFAVAIVMLAVALPLKIWIGQRNDNAALASQIRAAQVKVNQLKAQDRRWQDPGYVEQQARNRLHYAQKGQKTYIVLGGGRKSGHGAGKQHAPVAAGAWYQQLWGSVQSAGAGESTGSTTLSK
jgi:cell division protein FtsB